MERDIRLMLVEDDAELRASLSDFLSTVPRLKVVAAHAAAKPALDAVKGGLQLDVALVDLVLPGMAGDALIRLLKEARPDVEVIVLSAHEDADHLFSALSAGAGGYLLKHSAPAHIIEGIFQVVDGGAPMSPSIARRVVAAMHERPAPQPSPLTPRELEVLELLTKGATYELIAKALEIAVSTVQAHIKSIYRKLEVCTKAEATAEAYKRGWVV
jgi:DNA-binding NarL/FixJ family response regulator